MENTLNDIINENAEQVRLFLSLDKLSSNALVDEIKEEKKIEIKLSKLLYLLVNRLKYQFLHNNDNFLIVINRLKETLNEEIPKNTNDFVKWVINNHSSKQSKNLQNLIEENNKLNDENIGLSRKQTSIRDLKEENLYFKNEVQNLYNKIYRNKHNYQMQIKDLKEKLQNKYDYTNFEEQIHKYQYENQVLKKRIKSLKNELKNNQEIYQFDQTNKSRDLLINELQNFDCNCFKDIDLISSKHKKLHEKLLNLTKENQSLKEKTEDIKLKYKTMKSKYHELILTNTKLSEQNEQTKLDNAKLSDHIKKLEESSQRYQDIHQQITDLENQYDNLQNEYMKTRPSSKNISNSFDLYELKRKFQELEHAVKKLQMTISQRRKYLLSN